MKVVGENGIVWNREGDTLFFSVGNWLDATVFHFGDALDNECSWEIMLMGEQCEEGKVTSKHPQDKAREAAEKMLIKMFRSLGKKLGYDVE